MKSATVHEIKQELSHRDESELIALCLHLAKFKKENKELLTYLLYEAKDEASYIESIKIEVDELFDEINTNSFYYIKKSVRKILRLIKKYIRYSKKPETQVELLIYFCMKLRKMKPSMQGSIPLLNLYQRELTSIKKVVSKLHEDLQFDFQSNIEILEK